MGFAELLRAFTAAIEAGDGKRLGALFAEDGVYHDSFYGAFTGPAAIADMLEHRFWRDAERFKWEMRHPVCDGRTGYAEWTFSYTSRIPESRGTRVVFEGMSRFTLQQVRIASYQEVFNGGVALVQLGFAPARMATVLRRWNEQTRALPHVAAHLTP